MEKTNVKSASEESTEKLIQELHAPRKKPEMARSKKPEPVHQPDFAEEKTEEEIRKTKKEQAIEFVKKTSSDMKGGISVFQAFKAILGSGKLFFASIAVILIMMVLTFFFYHRVTSFVTVKTLDFFEIAPAADELFSKIYHALKVCSAFLFKIVVNVLSFYFSFILAYALTSPLYSFISMIAEDIYFGKPKDDAELSLEGVIEDVKQALKVTLAVFLLGVIAFFIGFVPVLGQVAALIFCFFMNALLIFDFVTSRRRWNFVSKAKWLVFHPALTLKTALLPTLISFVPVINTIFTAFLFPVFVVHATMNFACAERGDEPEKEGEIIES